METREREGLRQVRGPLRQSVHQRHHATPPPHHVRSGPPGLLGYLPSLFPPIPEKECPCEQAQELGQAPTSATTLETSSSHATPGTLVDESGPSDATGCNDKVQYTYSGFRNPWPSWHKPYLTEVWNGMHWNNSPDGGEGGDEAGQALLPKGEGPDEIGEDSGRDLHLLKPDFGNEEGGVQATWLGHASVLVQLPALSPGRRPLRVLFDPIFSLRCSPTQYFGPMRFFPPPCAVSELPAVDVVLISHSHYDHLDYDTIVELWQSNQDHLRFVVPLGNRDWFLGLNIGIGEDRVTELDWWDELWLDQGVGTGAVEETKRLRVICTPAQHGSGRYGLDSSRTLWSSWTLEHISQGNTFRIFFGGDTGFQFHSAAADDTLNGVGYPACPAFADIARRIGPPDLSFLPISVGATMNFVKSYDPLGLVPHLDHGLTGANHLTPSDAVRVAKIMHDWQRKADCTRPATVVAIHWGTFVNDLAEVRESMQGLQAACQDQGVEFVREVDQRSVQDRVEQQQQQQQQQQRHLPGLANGPHSTLPPVTPEKPSPGLQFACLDLGQSVYLASAAGGPSLS